MRSRCARVRPLGGVVLVRPPHSSPTGASRRRSRRRRPRRTEASREWSGTHSPSMLTFTITRVPRARSTASARTSPTASTRTRSTADLVLGEGVGRVERMAPGGAHHVELCLAALRAHRGPTRLPVAAAVTDARRGPLEQCEVRRLRLVGDDGTGAAAERIGAVVALVRPEVDDERVAIVARVRLVDDDERERGPVDLRSRRGRGRPSTRRPGQRRSNAAG